MVEVGFVRMGESGRGCPGDCGWLGDYAGLGVWWGRPVGGGGWVRIQLLGEVAIHGETATVHLKRSGERCVLAALALSVGTPVPVMTLVDCVWSPAEQSDKALRSVRDYVSKVRSAIREAGG